MPLITGNQLRAARALVNVDQQYVAGIAGINVNTVRNMEARGFEPITSGAVIVQRVQQSLEILGVDFIGGHEPGVKLQMIWGSPSQERDTGEWIVTIWREQNSMFPVSIAETLKMADAAAQRGDARTAAELRKAANAAERSQKEDDAERHD
jgi:hypothetical protein